jgi:hypothetical protein
MLEDQTASQSSLLNILLVLRAFMEEVGVHQTSALGGSSEDERRALRRWLAKAGPEISTALAGRLAMSREAGLPAVATREPRAVVEATLQCATVMVVELGLDSGAIVPDLFSALFGVLYMLEEFEEDADVEQLVVVALGCVNEVLNKAFVPPDFEQLVSKVHQQVIDWHGRAKCKYLDEFVQFAGIFVANHLSRSERSAPDEAAGFLELLFRFTFEQRDPQVFLECCEIWGTVLDHVAAQSTRDPGGGYLARYAPALLALSRELARKVMYSQNGAELVDLDDEEQESYVSTAVDRFGQVALLFPRDVVMQAVPLLSNALQAFHSGTMAMSLLDDDASLDTSTRTTRLILVGDAAAALRLVASVAEQTVPDARSPDKTSMLSSIESAVVTPLINLLRFLLQANAFSSTVPSVVDLCLQIAGSLMAYMHWVRVYADADSERGDALCHEVLSNALASLAQQRDASHLGASAKLVRSVAAVARPPGLVSFSATQQLLEAGPGLWLQHADIAAAVSTIILLPPVGHSPDAAEWQVRSTQYESFFSRIVEPFTSYSGGSTADAVRSLEVTEAVIASASDSSKFAKQALAAAARPMLALATERFSLFLSDYAMLNAMLACVTAGFDVLRGELGAEFVHNAVGVFMSALSQSEDTLQSVVSGGPSAQAVIISFLAMLSSIMGESSSRPLVPDVVNFTVGRVYTVLSQDPTGFLDVKSSLFSLLHSVLLSHWRWFHINAASMNAVQRHAALMSGRQIGSDDPEEERRRSEAFNGIIEAFLHSFSTDLRTFGENIRHLESLTAKVRLYSHHAFWPRKAHHLFTIFLTVLVDQTHNLLRDEIIAALFHLASVDFHVFYTDFLSAFLDASPLPPQLTQSLRSQIDQSVKDKPTFTTNLLRFVNDYVYYARSL